MISFFSVVTPAMPDMDVYTIGILGIVILFAVVILYFCLSNGVQFLFPKTKPFFDKVEKDAFGERVEFDPGDLDGGLGLGHHGVI